MTRTASEAAPRRARILQLPVDAVTLDAAVDFVARRVDLGRRCRIVVTNANKTWLASRNERLRSVMEQADLIVPEWATVWAGRVLDLAELSHVGGLNLMLRLLAAANEHSWSVALVGARPHVLKALVARIEREFPHVRLVAAHDGYFDAAEERVIRAGLAANQPDLLFVALGSPRQEFWTASIGDEVTVTLGVGGSFDVIAGFKKDSPVWMRGRGLEWIFRLYQDPAGLWRRYLVTNSWFVLHVVREKITRIAGRR